MWRSSDFGHSFVVSSVVFLVVSFLLISCTNTLAKKNDSEGFYSLPSLDHVLIQSPINILSMENHDLGRYKVTLHFQDAINEIENLEHTVQLDFEGGRVK